MILVYSIRYLHNLHYVHGSSKFCTSKSPACYKFVKKWDFLCKQSNFLSS